MEEHNQKVSDAKSRRRYLYGAQIYGIQSFILTSNKLKSIVAKSAVVEEICTDLFRREGYQSDESNILTMAAGKVICFFDTEEECKNAVRNFPKAVMSLALGVTISQAVVDYDSCPSFGEAMQELMMRLRTQRNKPEKSLTTGLMGIKRERETGLLVMKPYGRHAGDKVDHQGLNLNLCRKSFGAGFFENPAHEKLLTREHDALSGKDSWIAIVHADGNGMGSIVEKVGDDSNLMKEFSAIISRASEHAANKAFMSSVKNGAVNRFGTLQIRPIVLNGDDMTTICRADLALDYATVFCTEFENFMKTEVAKNPAFKGRNISGMTASAGIVYIKDHYPYHAAYNLSETLCSIAKDRFRHLGDNMPSCIMLHKVSDSFSENYKDDIMNRELSLPDGGTWSFGPYLTHVDHGLDGEASIEGLWSVDELRKHAESLCRPENSALWNALREWVTYMHEDYGENKGRANLFAGSLSRKYQGNEIMYTGVNRDGRRRYPTLDIINMALMNGAAESKVSLNSEEE